jgi:hypothetical protein
MTKSIVIILFIVLAILLGCTRPREDVKPDMQDSVVSLKQDVKSSLSDIEEIFANFNYEKIIDRHSPILPKNMSITKFKYFVVFSDLDEKTTYSVIDNDIRQTIDGMVNSYSVRTPDSATAVFLFTDFEDYKNFTLENTDIEEKDLSPYGYYKISQNIIVIRYVEWKGSTKHEISHRFTKADFPDAPSWFDEGLSSLNEKSVYRDGKLYGEFSWRIVALRRAIKEDRYTPLEQMMKTDDTGLYGKRVSYYYAQSRYLLGYLQERDLLEKYYKLFRDTFREDKTGISQLEEILGKPIDDIEKDYYAYITSFTQ